LRYILFCLALLLISCGDENPAGVDPSPSPSPEVSPSPLPVTKLVVIVRTNAVQNGKNGITVVQVNENFKVNGTATACFELTEGADPLPVKCPVIPLWSQRVIGGFSADCRPKGSLNSDSVQWSCRQAGDVTFEVCAQDFDAAELGCDIWAMEVN